MSKSTTPNLETAISGFQQMIEVMKTQKSSWTNYLTVQNSGDFVPFRILESAFFMQALANKQTLINYHDVIHSSNIYKILAETKDKGTLIYQMKSNLAAQYLYMIGNETILFIDFKSFYNDPCVTQVLTFDQALFDDFIKPMLNKLKEKNV